MIKILFLVAFTVSVASAGGYGGSGRASGGYGGSYGGGGSISIGGRGGGGLGLSAGGGFTSGATLSAGEIIPAAISSVHRIEFKDVPLSRDIKAATIEVGASPIPINIIFKSASSNLNVLQQHEGGRGDTQETTSEDEPTRLLHTVTKPIVQEVREVITPFRKITQEIQPVQEEIQTIVARGTEIGRSTSLGGLALGGGSRALVEKTTKTLKNINFDALVEKAELAAKGTGLGLGLVGKSASSYRARARA